MDSAFRFLIMAGVTYLTFLCVVRIAVGNQYKSKSFLINIIGMFAAYGSFIVSRYKSNLNIPDFLYYILIVLLTVFLPPLSLKMKSEQTLRYIACGVVAVPLLHLLFSLLLGWGELLPSIQIPSLWQLF
ncbi:MAG TPA: hypothetical protein GXZ22_07410 [Clostridiaceae bacterium]|nr:hypothetical protein [Clostridiaceae bacterium]